MVKVGHKEKKKNNKIAAGIAVLIVLAVLLAGPALAFGVSSLLGEVTHTVGTRTITVDLNITKNTNEVISTDGITAKLGSIAVDANADTIDLSAGPGTNVDFNISSTSSVCTSANNSLSYGYSYGTENYYPGYGYMSGYGYGYGYDNPAGNEIQCTFTFNNVPEGVYVAIAPYVNGTTDQYMLEVKTLDKVIGVLDLNGTATKELNFIMPDAGTNGSVGNNTLMTKLMVSGVRNINNDTNYISVAINNNIDLDYGSATATGDVFEFGPTGSTFTDANITIYYAKIADLNAMSNSDLTTRLNIYQYHGTTWSNLGGTVDTTNKQISVDLEEFSAYTSGLAAASSSHSSSSNPASSGTTTVSTTTEKLSYTPIQLQTALEAMIDDTGAQLFTSTEIATMVANSSNYEFERTVLVEKIVTNGVTSYKVTVTTTVKNITNGDLKDVKVVIEVPKQVASDASLVTSLIPFTILVNDPVLQFNLASLKAGQEASIAYTVTSTTNPNLTNVKFSTPAILAATKVTTPVVIPGTTPDVTPDTTPGTTPAAPMDYTLLIVLVVIIVVVGAAYFLVIKKK